MTREQQVIIDLANKGYTETGTGEVAMACPFCGTPKKKLYVSRNGKFICFICNTRGNSVFSFIKQYYDCSYSEAKAILQDHNLSDNYVPVEIDEHISLLTRLVQLKHTTISTKTLVKFPSGVTPLIDNLNNPEAYPYFNYLYKRGITLNQIKQFKISYLVQGSVKRTNKVPLTISHSIVFYTYDQTDRKVYWSTRSIDPHPYIKSINAPASDNEISRKDIIFNMNQINNQSNMVICEGIFNAITSTNSNYTGIATLGKAITDKQISLMTSLNPKRYYIFLDNDAKDQELKLAKRLHDKGIDYSRIYLVKNPYGEKDANDLGSSLTKQLLDQAQPITLRDMILLARVVK